MNHTPRTSITNLVDETQQEVSVPEMAEYLDNNVNPVTYNYLAAEIDKFSEDECFAFADQLRSKITPSSIHNSQFQINYFDPELSVYGDFELVFTNPNDKRGQLLQERGAFASFRYPNEIALRSSYVDLKSRIKGWVLGLRVTFPSTVEECVEHECRHGLTSLACFEYTNPLPEMDEGFAMATMETVVNYPELPDVFDFDRQRIADYQSLFLLAQAKGCDEFELLTYLNKNKFFGTYYIEEVDYTEPASHSTILRKAKEYINANSSKRLDLDEKASLIDYRQELYERRIKWHYQVVNEFSKFNRSRLRQQERDERERKYSGY